MNSGPMIILVGIYLMLKPVFGHRISGTICAFIWRRYMRRVKKHNKRQK